MSASNGGAEMVGVPYLASDDAGHVMGQTFTIDGGLTMNWGQGV